jgi:hypothetical protein
LCGQSSLKPSTKPLKFKLSKLLRELSDDDDSDCTDSDARPTVLEDPNRPWLQDFRAYLDMVEYVQDDWTTITWWGVSDSQINVFQAR